ncbi:MAG: redoxin domain-containing protein [Candidatus Heimdallarchaeota archaeon]|nr:redoxin domain-containing protein [Candidatus Heimdallarchaeota archaeon]MDH5646849.1 redoxin domain-containing protein [Candidatus Heimdallarchaeota archaeon]
MVEIGDTAPNAKVKLSDIDNVNIDFELNQAYEKGKTVLYFFPAAFTGVCSSSSCSIRDDISDFKELGANIYGISVDLPFSQKVFIKTNELNYPVLSDWNKEAITGFGIVDENFANFFRGIAKRSLFVIDENKITYKWVADNPGVFPPFDELKSHLKS